MSDNPGNELGFVAPVHSPLNTIIVLNISTKQIIFHTRHVSKVRSTPIFSDWFMLLCNRILILMAHHSEGPEFNTNRCRN